MMLEPVRLVLALGLLAAYAGVCVHAWRRVRRAAPDQIESGWLVVYATQTGTAQELAQRTHQLLETAGVSVSLLGIDRLTPTLLQSHSRLLLIASTYGEGDAPDMAALFGARTMAAPLPLHHLHVGLLALGDSSYQHYRQFGLQLEDWLLASGAVPLIPRIDMDRADPAAWTHWQHHLSHLAGTDDAPDWETAPLTRWKLAQRSLANAGSAGAPVYDLFLTYAGDGEPPHWEAGDLVKICPPADPRTPREYSIASLPAEGGIRLLLRLHRREDGQPGLASGWLCTELALASEIELQVRPHPRFRLPPSTAPVILIGNGTGIAGLRAHLAARVHTEQHGNWLLYGERQRAHDALFSEDLARWQASGALPCLHLTYSRDGDPVRYVQDVLRREHERLRDWVARGATILVCGSLQGMATDVHAALADILGRAERDALAANGRYRRDVY